MFQRNPPSSRAIARAVHARPPRFLGPPSLPAGPGWREVTVVQSFPEQFAGLLHLLLISGSPYTDAEQVAFAPHQWLAAIHGRGASYICSASVARYTLTRSKLHLPRQTALGPTVAGSLITFLRWSTFTTPLYSRSQSSFPGQI